MDNTFCTSQDEQSQDKLILKCVGKLSAPPQDHANSSEYIPVTLEPTCYIEADFAHNIFQLL